MNAPLVGRVGAVLDVVRILENIAVPEWGLRVVVTGGRDYDGEAVVEAALTQLHVTELAQGGASGADRLAALWAHAHKVPCVTFAADWAKHGRAAGPIRNRHMLDTFRPDAVVAFPGGRGTAHMVSYADFCGVPVIDFRPKGVIPDGVA